MNLRINFKKQILVLVVFVLAVFAVACGSSKDEAAQEKAKKVYISTTEAYVEDIPLAKYVQGDKEAKITWTSNDTSIIEITEYDEGDPNKEMFYLGKVTVPEEQKSVTLTATVSYQDGTGSVKFVVKVGNNYVEKTVAEAKESDLGTLVKLEGTVVFTSGSGYVLKDSTGYIYMYGSNHGRKVGEKVVVRGELAVYNSMIQLKNAGATVVGEEPAGFDPSDDAEVVEIKDLINHNYKDKMFYSKMFKVKGTLKESDNSNAPYEIASPYNPAEAIGITKYTSDESKDYIKKFIAAHKDEVGQVVEVTVVIYDYRSGAFSVLFPETAVEGEVDYTTQQAVDTTLNELQDELSGQYVTGDLDLATTYTRFGTNVTWVSSHPEILANDGKVNMPNEDTKVTLTVSVEKDGKTATGTIEVTVKKLDVSKVEDILELTPKTRSEKILVLVEGKVISYQYKGYWVADETGAILVYTGKTEKDSPYPALGSMVSVKGGLTTYGEANSFTAQISPTEVTELTDATEPTIIAPVTKTFEELLALGVTSYDKAREVGMDYYGKFITITGKVRNDGNQNYWWIIGDEANEVFRLNNLYSNTGLTKDETITITVLVREIYFIDDTSDYNNYKQGTFGGVFVDETAIVKK